jgi:pilus assembly protein FimV
MQKNHRLSLALALALGTSQAWGLGLGGIRVSSSLNEPLVAEIPIISNVAGEVDGLKVKLASPDAFARVGIDRTALLPANLEFTVVKNAAGQPVVRVTTPNRLGEPILNFLLEVEWGRGRMLREYTVLLDPPRVAPARVTPAVAAPVAEAPAAAVAPLPPSAAPKPPPPIAQPSPTPAPARPSTPPPAATAPAPAPMPAPARPAPAATPAAALASPDRYGPVSGGETLWAIAQQVRPDSSVSMNQTMLALLRANPDAFIGDNINRLKRGAVLRIPTRDELSALTAAAAAAEVSEQARAWREDSAGSAPSSVSVPSEPVAAVERAPASSTAAPASASRLELLPPGGDKPASGAQSGSSDAGAGVELRADLSRAREQVATLEQENRDLRSRVTDLERLDGDTKRMLELKDSQLAEAQRRLSELEAARDLQEAGEDVVGSAVPAAAEEVAEDSSATSDEVAGSAGDQPDADALASDADAAVDADADAVAGDEAASTDEMAPAGLPPAGVDPATDVQPVAEADPAPTQSLDEPAPEPIKPWYLQTWAMLAGLGVVIAGLLAFLLGRRRPSATVSESRESIADQYEAAEASAAARQEHDADGDVDSELDHLLDAVAEQPNDLGRHLALVGHYYRQSDASGFEGAAEAMYAQLYDAEHPSWRQVVAMGRDLLPDHPLFFEVPAAQTTAPSVPDFDPMPEPAAPASFEPDDDWGAAPAAPPASKPGGDATQNFSVDEIDRLRVAAASANPFDTQPVGQPAIGAVQQESDAGQYGGDEDGDEAAATKLELARAYLDMGDVEGARGMLEEVIGEGNPGQRAEARRLLDEIR